MEQESLFSDEEIEVMETKESKAGKEAKAVFDAFYHWFVEGNYTQSAGQIVKVFKEAILSGKSAHDVQWAANILGEKEQAITRNSLQFAFSQIKQYKVATGYTDTTPNSNDKEYVETL